MTVEEAGAQAAGARPRMRMSGVVARLTVANALAAASGFITGPLLARTLEPSGRGDLAAVVVPLTLVPAVLGFGIPNYAYRTLPRGRPAREVIGSLGLPLALIGLLAAAAAVPVADALAGGRETVRTYLIVGFMATPVVLVGLLLIASVAALELWRARIAMAVIPFAVPFVAIVALYATGHLTVATAAAATIAGGLLSIVPALPLVIRSGRPVFRFSLACEGISFGVKSWLGGLAQLANLRLDQFLMITAVAPRELGLYAVATTISGASGLATGAIAPPLAARVGSGQTNLMAQAVRICVIGTLGLNVVLALITPVLLSVLFGPAFRDATAMAIVLLAANVPFAGSSVLSTALIADGAPLIPSLAEGMALVITVVGLAVLLGPLGGLGAAIVSLAAYSASFLYQLVMASRRTRLVVTNFLVPSRADAVWARSLLSHVTPPPEPA
jgi:O-antigen/teichoic acid export membrane protein